jgi:hypothetical protein
MLQPFLLAAPGGQSSIGREFLYPILEIPGNRPSDDSLPCASKEKAPPRRSEAFVSETLKKSIYTLNFTR